MIDRIIAWSLGNRPVVLALSVIFLIGGSWVAVRMPVDVLPDLTAPTVTILVEGRGMAPTDMEALVTFPIETALNGAAGVRRVRSATAVGIAVIWVEFEWGEDIYRARQTVSERVTAVAADLPSGVDPPALAPVSSIMGEILFIALRSDRHDDLALRTIAETQVRRRLLAVPGVSQVVATGGGERQFQVVVSPDHLIAAGVSLAELEAALRGASRNTSAGFMVATGQEYLIQGIGQIRSLADIEATVVTARDTRPIFVRDLATVRIGEALRRGEGSYNGEPAIILGIQRQPDVNTLQLTQTLERAFDDIQATLPEGVRIERDVMRQADFIEVALANLNAALRDGTLLVVLVTVVFLANLRAAGITLVAIPLSLLAAVIAFRMFGLTINSMTLGGLAIAIGALVDDAIVDVENILRRLRENARTPDADRRPLLDVVYTASCEIRRSIVFATLIVMLVFLPLFFLADVEGRLLRPLGLAYLIALFASLVVALTVTPVLSSYLLPRLRSVREATEPAFAQWLKRQYGRILPATLDHRFLVLAGAGVLLVLTAVALPRMGRAFLPEFNEGALVISAVTLPGTSLEASDQLGASLERLLRDVPEVVSTARRTGRAERDEHVQGVESAEIDVKLQASDRTRDEVLAHVRTRLSLLPGVNVTLGQPISHRIDHMLSGTRANVAIKIFGDDLHELRSIGERVQAAVADVTGLVDLSVEQQTDIPTVRVQFDRAALGRFGLQAGVAADALETALVGREVGQILDQQVAVPLVVRYPAADVPDLDAIRQTPLRSATGGRVPVEAVAEVIIDRSPNFISRENVQRKITVTGNVAGRDLGSVVGDARRAVADGVPLPPGYRIEFSGQFESSEQASSLLFWLSLGVIVAMFFMLTAAFRSAPLAGLIMVNLPLALIGGIAGVFVSGGVLSVASIIGLIALLGIAARNGIMLVSHIEHLRNDEGVTDLREAVTRGSIDRLVPILMTALSTGLALVPVALGAGEPGSEIQAPMASVIIFGLASSTVLNMLVVPASYYALHHRDERRRTEAIGAR
ncbi:MAG: efflux RND transporter permease subunit [Vicinamibacterales bacterium]|nr:efflux RND transporter permease subunit [Vicinamibacterales bacterium]